VQEVCVAQNLARRRNESSNADFCCSLAVAGNLKECKEVIAAWRALIASGVKCAWTDHSVTSLRPNGYTELTDEWWAGFEVYYIGNFTAHGSEGFTVDKILVVFNIFPVLRLSAPEEMDRLQGDGRLVLDLTD
jgi:hypothetical protein